MWLFFEKRCLKLVGKFLVSLQEGPHNSSFFGVLENGCFTCLHQVMKRKLFKTIQLGDLGGISGLHLADIQQCLQGLLQG